MINSFKKNAPQFPKLLKLLLAFAIPLSVMEVKAEPYLAVRTGFKCSECHVNRIGGGERTEYGSAYTQYKLLMTQTQGLMDAQQGGLSSFSPKLNSAITIGANFRTEEVGTLSYSGTDTAGHSYSAPSSQQLNVKEANLYINVELVKNFLNLYMDETLGPLNAGNREMWMMVRGLPLNGYVKIGKTLLPYGLRLMDDEAFIRANTGYTYNNPDLAAEIGIEPGPFSFTANVTSTRFNSVGSIVYRHFRVGGSYGTSILDAHINKFDTYGPFVGINFGRFTAMSEVDFISKATNGSDTADLNQVAQFYELDFLPIQGVNTKATYEYFDQNTSVANKRDGQARWTFGVEPFVTRFLQLGIYYRLNQYIPQNATANQSSIIGRAHVFF